MQQERIISADSHMNIKDEVFFKYLPKRHHDGLLALREQTRGRAGERSRMLHARMPWPAAGRAGEWDPHERLKDMDVDRVDAEVLYSSTDAGASFYPLKDGGRRAAFEAYNNAAMDFASPEPRRLLPVYLLPVADVEEAVGEARRLASAGARAFMVPLYPTDLGLKPYWDRSWDPLWYTVQEAGVPLSQHLGANAYQLQLLGHDPTPLKGIFRALSPIWMVESVAGWCMSGLLHRFPGLKVVLVEGGLGWVPYFLERMDRTVLKIQWGKDVLAQPPSFYWRQSMAATFEEDVFGVRNRELIGVDNLMWATDYPHPDSTWPESQNVIRQHFQGVPRDEMRKIVAGNAARFYGLN